MKQSNRILIAAGMVNVLGVLFFSLGLTNQPLVDLSPDVFSRFGLFSIILWGGAYFATVRIRPDRSAILWVFSVEKMAYVATWLVWMLRHGGVGAAFDQSSLTGIFYLLYGPIDFGFGILFALIALRKIE